MRYELGFRRQSFSFTAGYLSERSDLGLELSTSTKVIMCVC